MRNLLFTFLLSLLLCVACSPNLPGSCDATSTNADRFTEHEPIEITKESDFTKAKGVVAGKGTANDPFIIEGWRIVANKGTGIYVRCNTIIFYIIRNCLIIGGDIVIYLNNGLIMNNIVNNPNGSYGIYIGAKNIIVYNNTIIASYGGIELTNAWEEHGGPSGNIRVISNKINALNGVDIQHGNRITVASNFFCGYSGILCGECDNASIANNNFYTSIGCEVSGRNEIHHNNFFPQSAKGVMNESLGCDEWGESVWYDSQRMEGNYWHNWDGEGWGTPSAYPIKLRYGANNVSDYYPLRTPLTNQTICAEYNQKISVSEKVRVYTRDLHNKPIQECNLTLEFGFSGPNGFEVIFEKQKTDVNGTAELEVKVKPQIVYEKQVIVILIKSSKSGYLDAYILVILTTAGSSGVPWNLIIGVTLACILTTCLIAYVAFRRKNRTPNIFGKKRKLQIPQSVPKKDVDVLSMYR